MKVLAVIALSASLFCACEREPVLTAFPEPVDIKVDAEGKITLNGEAISLEQLDARLKSNSGSILVETDADGKSFVTVNDRKMTLKEYSAFVAERTKRGAGK